MDINDLTTDTVNGNHMKPMVKPLSFTIIVVVLALVFYTSDQWLNILFYVSAWVWDPILNAVTDFFHWIMGWLT
jgi:hypothetical protein